MSNLILCKNLLSLIHIHPIIECKLFSKKGTMQDIHIPTPCKVVLSDFDYKRFLNARLFLEKQSVTLIAVLEEILFSPLKVFIEELEEATGCFGEEMDLVLQTLSPLHLFHRDGKNLIVDKEIRKYLEIITEKFNPDFCPNLDYFKEVLKHVPIHCLISWYHIPRASNNIFNSILDKHFKTPKIYKQYIQETLSDNLTLSQIVNDVMNSENRSLPAQELMIKYSLSETVFEEMILFLELHFILCTTYEVKGHMYKKYLSAFIEWKEYLKKDFKGQDSQVSIKEELVENCILSEFSFIKDMSTLLTLSNKRCLKVTFNPKDELFFLDSIPDDVVDLHNHSPLYLAKVINKSLLLGLLVVQDDRLRQTPPAEKWLETPLRKRTLISFKHPHNALSHKSAFTFHQHDRNIIEVQKALSSIKQGEWILFDEFINTYLSTTNNLKQASLTKIGGGWKYTSADYEVEEIEFIRTMILEWLFESGMVLKGSFQNKDCFKVSSLGYELYS
jgi:hypothetical protein